MQVNVSGKVIDTTNKAVKGAFVWGEDSDFFFTSKDNGGFSLAASTTTSSFYAALGTRFGQVQAKGRQGELIINIQDFQQDDQKQAAIELLVSQKAPEFHRAALQILLKTNLELARKNIRTPEETADLWAFEISNNRLTGEPAVQESMAARDSFKQCYLLQSLAGALYPVDRAWGERAWKAASELWNSGSVGGNDLLFEHAALSTLYSPQTMVPVLQTAAYWARTARDTDHELARLAAAVCKYDFTQGLGIASKISPPAQAAELLFMARSLSATSTDSAIKLILQANTVNRGKDKTTIREFVIPFAESSPSLTVKNLLDLGTINDSSYIKARIILAGAKSDRPQAIRTMTSLVSRKLDDVTLSNEPPDTDLLELFQLLRLFKNFDLAASRRPITRASTLALQRLTLKKFPPATLVEFVLAAYPVAPALCRAALHTHFNDRRISDSQRAELASAMSCLDVNQALEMTRKLPKRELVSACEISIGAYVLTRRQPRLITV